MSNSPKVSAPSMVGQKLILSGIACMALAPLCRGQVTHDKGLQVVDDQAMKWIRSQGTSSKLEQVTDDLIKQALKPHTEIGAVYKAILFADARAWDRGQTGIAASPEGESLIAAFAKFKAPRTYESLKATLLARYSFFGSYDDWDAAKQLVSQTPSDELPQLAYLAVKLGYWKDPSVGCAEVREEAGRQLSLHPRYLGLMEVSAIAELQDGMTHPDRKRACLIKARDGFKAYIAKAHPETFHSQTAAHYIKKLDKVLDNN